MKDAAQRPVPERTVVFVVAGAGSEFREAVITNHAGEAILDNLALPAGDYTVTAYFGGIPTLDLDDVQYGDSSATGKLKVNPGNAAPTTGDDAVKSLAESRSRSPYSPTTTTWMAI